CTHTEAAATTTCDPPVAVIDRPVAMATTRSATSSTSVITAPGSPRGTSVPSGRYPRSANASVTVGTPTATAWDSTTAPGRPRIGNGSSEARSAYRTAAATTPAACAESWTIRL